MKIIRRYYGIHILLIDFLEVLLLMASVFLSTWLTARIHADVIRARRNMQAVPVCADSFIFWLHFERPFRVTLLAE